MIAFVLIFAFYFVITAIRWSRYEKALMWIDHYYSDQSDARWMSDLAHEARHGWRRLEYPKPPEAK